MALEHLWAAWRADYMAGTTKAPTPTDGQGCVFCRILAGGEDDEERLVLWRGRHVFALLNLFPYTSGHLMVLPYRHVGEIEELESDEAAELWSGVTDAVVALKAAYGPEGLNLGANLGRAAGAGVLGHLHVHVLPRWFGDSNFMTPVAEARVVPEELSATARRLRAAWPAPG